MSDPNTSGTIGVPGTLSTMITIKLTFSEKANEGMEGIEIKGTTTADNTTALETVTVRALKPKLVELLTNLGKDLGASQVITIDKESPRNN